MSDNLELVLDPPWGQYYVENVSGTVEVALVESQPQNYERIQVELVGYAHVQWNMDKTTVSDHENFQVVRQVVWRRDGSQLESLRPRSFTFPFVLPLTELSMPSTLSDESGPSCAFGGPRFRIQYEVVATIVGPGAAEQRKAVSVPVSLHQHVDIHRQPSLLLPHVAEARKTVCWLCCASGPVALMARVPRTGFCTSRDFIPLEIVVDNRSNRSISQITIEIRQLITYRAQPYKRKMKSTMTHVTFPAAVPGGGSQTYHLEPLAVPFTIPTLTGSRLITVDYFLRITTHIAWATNLILDIPIVLGNVPLRQED